MASKSERILELIDLQHRRSVTRRVLSAAGLVLGGGLLAATIMLVMRARARAPHEAEPLAAAPGANGVRASDSLRSASTPVHDGHEVPLRDGHAAHG